MSKGKDPRDEHKFYETAQAKELRRLRHELVVDLYFQRGPFWEAIKEIRKRWQQEVSGRTDEVYHGHGPTFRDKANEIGARLGVGRVRTCKRRGKGADLPSCSQWPHNVRPSGYYLGAVCDTRPRVSKVALTIKAVERNLRDRCGE